MVKFLMPVVLFGFAPISLQACHAKSPETKPPPQQVTLHFGHQGVRDFYTYTHGKSENYPEIMSFSDLNWRPPTLGIVDLKHFDSNTRIPMYFLLWVYAKVIAQMA